MTKSTFPMTKQGYDKLLDELTRLETETRIAASKRVNHARRFCDFREDSEYEATLKKRSQVEARISELKQMIQHAEIIEDSPYDHVEIGSTITWKNLNDNNEETYTTVDPEEVDPSEGKISYNAPIAKQLLHAKIGDIVRLTTPSGSEKIKIIKIS